MLVGEVWLSVPGYPGYEVSSLGRVRGLERVVLRPNGKRVQRGRLMTLTATSNGYLAADLSLMGKTRTMRVHRLVLAAFVRPAEAGEEACHCNGNRTDNRLDNLRWDTRKSNAADRKRHGTGHQGERHPLAKLTEAQAREILNDPRSVTELARVYGVSKSCVSAVRTGQTWGHLHGNP